MGVNTGFCTVGNFGSNDRMNYTAVGTEVNLASRLETACTPGEVLISSSTYILIQEKYVCKDSGDVKVKGFAEPVPVFTALGTRKDLDKATDYLNYSSAGFSINIDTDAIPNYDRKKVLEALKPQTILCKGILENNNFHYCRINLPFGSTNSVVDVRKGQISIPPRRRNLAQTATSSTPSSDLMSWNIDSTQASWKPLCSA